MLGPDGVGNRDAIMKVEEVPGRLAVAPVQARAKRDLSATRAWDRQQMINLYPLQ